MLRRQAYDVAKDRVKISHFTEQGFDINGVVHIGANDGYELQWYLAMGITNIIAFEPLPSAYELLRAYEKSGVVCVPAGLGKKNELKTLHVAQGDGQSSTFLDMIDTQWDHLFIDHLDINIVTFKDWYNWHKDEIDIRGYDCLVCDVEGMEKDVLEGMGDLLSNFKYLNIECRSKQVYKQNILAQEMIDFLDEKGFRQDSDIQELDDIFFIRKDVL